MEAVDKKLIDGNRFRFVLSTGRTGTTQFREFLKKTHRHLEIAFEPEPSRLAYLLWNAEQSGLMFRNTALNLLLNSKLKQLGKTDKNRTIIEFDSYLSPLICNLFQSVENIHIVHMIRHPYTWIQSIGNFKAASWRKYAVDVVPFTETIAPEKSGQWRELNKYEKLAWTWRYVNEQIVLQKPSCNNYQLVKFEDFIADDPDVRIKAINHMLRVIDPAFDNSEFDIDVSDKLNKSHNNRIPGWESWPIVILNSVNEICGRQMLEFDYEIYRP